MNGIGLDLLPSSLVHDSLSACLLEKGTEDLVLCKGKNIELYRLGDGNRLCLHGIYSFGAAIKAMDRVRSSPTDMLALRFADCKVFHITRSVCLIARCRLSGLVGSLTTL